MESHKNNATVEEKDLNKQLKDVVYVLEDDHDQRQKIQQQIKQATLKLSKQNDMQQLSMEFN